MTERAALRSPRLLLAAAGTGGHVYPGIAVAREWLARGHGDIVALGTAGSIEARIVPHERLRLEFIPSSPLRGGPGRLVVGAAMAPVALASAIAAIRRLRPDVVFATGGHVSGAVIAAARACGVPSLLFECNAAPGLANRLSAPAASAIAVGWDESAWPAPRLRLVSGVPVRRELFAVPEANAAGRASLLVFGGSAGSARLDEVMVRAAAALPTLRERVRVVHITSAERVARVAEGYRASQWDAQVTPYVDEIAREYAACTIVVGHAGASTCAEVAATRRASVLVPLDVAGGHQHRNAAVLASAGAALVATADEAFADAIRSIIESDRARVELEARVAALARPGAAALLVDTLERLVAGRRGVKPFGV